MKLNLDHALCPRCNGPLMGVPGSSHTATRESPTPVCLTHRERLVYRLLCYGLTNKQIATHLVISENTVRFHLKSLYAKLGVRSRSRAVALTSGQVESSVSA